MADWKSEMNFSNTIHVADAYGYTIRISSFNKMFSVFHGLEMIKDNIKTTDECYNIIRSATTERRLHHDHIEW